MVTPVEMPRQLENPGEALVYFAQLYKKLGDAMKDDSLLESMGFSTRRVRALEKFYTALDKGMCSGEVAMFGRVSGKDATPQTAFSGGARSGSFFVRVKDILALAEESGFRSVTKRLKNGHSSLFDAACAALGACTLYDPQSPELRQVNAMPQPAVLLSPLPPPPPSAPDRTGFKM